MRTDKVLREARRPQEKRTSSMPAGFVLLISWMLVISTSCTHASTRPTPPRDRYEFAQALTKLHEGMPAEEAKRLLGQPEDIRTQNDPDGLLGWARTKEIWHYGTNGHLTLGTLGAVFIDEHNLVQYVFGLKYPPPPRGMFDEEELRRILRVIDQAPKPDGREFNPRKLIAAINTLQPLGKEKALAALKEYLRITDDIEQGQNEFLILRTLFDVPDSGFMPRMIIGMPVPDGPKDLKRIPRFPVAIVDDVPFMLVDRYAIAGMPQPSVEHLTYFSKYGRLRAKQLVPSNHLLDIYDKALIIANNDLSGNSRTERRMLAEQLLSLVDTVYRPPGVIRDQVRLVLSETDFQSQWNKRRDEVAKLDIRWSAKENKYVFAKDGSSLPDRVFKNYFRQVVMLMPFGQSGEISVQRADDDNVRFNIQVETPVNSQIFVRLLTSSSDHPEIRHVAITFTEVPPDTSQRGDVLRSDLKVENPSNQALDLSHRSAGSSSTGNDFSAWETRSCGVKLKGGSNVLLQVQIGNKATDIGPWVP